MVDNGHEKSLLFLVLMGYVPRVLSLENSSAIMLLKVEKSRDFRRLKAGFATVQKNVMASTSTGDLSVWNLQNFL
ncbi:MAG: hypothetical protein JW902_09600 [Syntrophaceae bacterium]|nr:hypothetical protein [Syntrophaceae bacterium]